MALVSPISNYPNCCFCGRRDFGCLTTGKFSSLPKRLFVCGWVRLDQAACGLCWFLILLFEVEYLLLGEKSRVRELAVAGNLYVHAKALSNIYEDGKKLQDKNLVL